MPRAKTQSGGTKPKPPKVQGVGAAVTQSAYAGASLTSAAAMQAIIRANRQELRQERRERRQDRREDRREARQDARMEQRRENRQERRQERRAARQEEPKASPASWEQKTSKPAGGGGGGGGGGATNPVAAGSPTFQEMRGQSLEELVRGGRKGARQSRRRGVE